MCKLRTGFAKPPVKRHRNDLLHMTGERGLPGLFGWHPGRGPTTELAGLRRDAVKEVSLQVPLVVRLEGTNVETGRKILGDSGLKITPAEDMADGAKKIVALAKGR